MARLFTCGFEENNLTATMWDAASATIISTQKHSGSYAVQLVTNLFDYLRRNLVVQKTSGTLFLRFYFRTNTLTNGERIFYWANDGGTVIAAVNLLSSGALRVTNNVTSQTVDTTATLVVDTWYRIEVAVVIDNTAGSIELRLYSADETVPIETISLTSQDTLDGGIRDLFFTSAAGFALTFLLDDIAINDETGSFQNSWPGPGKIALMTPNGDNAVAWTKGGSAPETTNYTGVSDLPGTPNDGTAYNHDSGSTNEDRLDLFSLPAEVPAGATLKVMHVAARVSASAASGTMALKVWNESGTGTEGPTFTVDSTTWRIMFTSEMQVVNLAGKTKANLDSYSAGYVAKSGAVEKRITALWANVEWTESGPPPDTDVEELIGQMVSF